MNPDTYIDKKGTVWTRAEKPMPAFEYLEPRPISFLAGPVQPARGNDNELPAQHQPLVVMPVILAMVMAVAAAFVIIALGCCIGWAGYCAVLYWRRHQIPPVQEMEAPTHQDRQAAQSEPVVFVHEEVEVEAMEPMINSSSSFSSDSS